MNDRKIQERETIDFSRKKCLTVTIECIQNTEEMQYRRNAMTEMKLKALAKINLGLDVLRRREDGYHEVRMIMQTVSLYDKIIIQKIKKPEIQVKTNLF